ncbi:hypothetical protein QTP86_007023 [Hemibagrus guttatus]|nr:hypothetical protein QTP86_007023 [Hemibagrus guttatus]
MAPMAVVVNPGLDRSGEDSFELHSVDLELEAVEKQIRDLQVKQAQLRQRKAALESPSARTRPAQVSFTPAPGYHAAWMQQQRKTRAKPRARTSPPPPPPVFEISTQNRFAPLRETECDTVIIGDSIVRHVPAILKKNIGAVVLHAGTNDIRLRQTEILKKDFRSLVELVRTTSPTTRIIVSGPLPTFQRGIERYRATPPQGLEHHLTRWNTTSRAGTPPHLLEHHLTGWNTTSPAGTPPHLLEHHLTCWNTTSPAGTPPNLLEHHLTCWNTTSSAGTPPHGLEHHLTC